MRLSDWLINADGRSPSFTYLYTTQYKIPSSQYSIRLRYTVDGKLDSKFLQNELVCRDVWLKREFDTKFWILLCFRMLQHAASQKYPEVPTNDHTTPLQPTLWEIQTPKMHQYAPHTLIKLACKSITYRRTYLTGTVWNCYWETLPRGNSTFCRRTLIFHLTANCRVVHSLHTHRNSPSSSRYA